MYMTHRLTLVEIMSLFLNVHLFSSVRAFLIDLLSTELIYLSIFGPNNAV